ncbi:MAG: diacylglycerol kinase [Croceivirga sp.]
MSKEHFLINRIKSVGYAFKGLFILLSTESSIKIQLVIAVLVTFAGWYFDISKIEWIIQIICIGMVLGIEGLNTAIEKIADYVQPEFDKQIGVVKDISAGAVMAVSLASFVVGCMIYGPKLF